MLETCEGGSLKKLNPTIADGLWTWRQHLGRATMIVSALDPDATFAAARELARQSAGGCRTVVLTGVGATEPLFWHVAAGKELDTVVPDQVLLLVQNHFAASSRLLLAVADHVLVLAGSAPEEQVEALRLIELILEKASPVSVEVVVVADSDEPARAAGGHIAEAAAALLGRRVAWRFLPRQGRSVAGRADHLSREEEDMASAHGRPVVMSDAELRTREWEECFHRAELLLREAQETLRQQLDRSAEPIRAAQLDRATEQRQSA